MTHFKDPIDLIGRVDPIDGELLASSWSASAAEAALFEEITHMSNSTLAPPAAPARTTVGAAATAFRPRRSRRPFVLVAALAAAVFGLVIVRPAVFEADAAYAVRLLPDGGVHVTVSPSFRDGEALAAELRDYGIDVEVKALASSPSLVGEVEVFGPPGDGGKPAGLEFGADGTPDVFEWTIDPDVFAGTLTVELHVEAKAGEAYGLAESAFVPGEVLGGLQCALGAPVRATEVAPYLDDLGSAVVWLVVSPTADPSITSESEVDAVPDGTVVAAHALDDQTVQLSVVPDGVSIDQPPWGELSDIACTPEQAAAWN